MKAGNETKRNDRGIFLTLAVFLGWQGNPWKSKDYFLNGFSVKNIVLVGIYNQQFKGTILFMVFDFQGSWDGKEIENKTKVLEEIAKI